MADKKYNPEDSGNWWQNIKEAHDAGRRNRTYEGAEDDLRKKLLSVGVPDNVVGLVGEYVGLANNNTGAPVYMSGARDAERQDAAQRVLDAVVQYMSGANYASINENSLQTLGKIINWTTYLGALKHFGTDQIYVTGMYPLPVPKDKAKALDNSGQSAEAIRAWVREVLPWKEKTSGWFSFGHDKKDSPEVGDNSMSATLQRLQKSIGSLDTAALSDPEAAVRLLEPILGACYDALRNNSLSPYLTNSVEEKMQEMQTAINTDADYAIRFVGTVLTNDYPKTLRWLADCGLPTDRKSENAILGEYNNPAKGYNRVGQTVAERSDSDIASQGNNPVVNGNLITH